MIFVHAINDAVQILIYCKLLFILSLLLSYFHNHVVGENPEFNASTVNNHVRKGPSTILTSGVTPADYVEFNESMFF